MALIDDLLIQAQRDLAAREQLIVRQLLDRYGVALRRIERELRTIDAQLAELIASESDITEQIIRRQRWWREVEASIQREMARWSNDAAQGLAALQTGGVRVGVAVASEIANAAGSPFQGRVYAEAFERWVSAIQSGSPVRNVIDGYGGRVSESILQRMTEGIGNGRAPRSIVREVMADVGGVGSEARIMSLARTETMRSFRGASADTYAKLPDGVVVGYRWIAHLATACPACVARHGTFYRSYPTGWHPNCRCVARAQVDPNIVPGGGWSGDTGPEWLAKQDEATQRRVLLSDERFNRYRSGVPIGDMVTVRHSPVWGDSIATRPIRDTPKAA